MRRHRLAAAACLAVLALAACEPEPEPDPFGDAALDEPAEARGVPPSSSVFQAAAAEVLPAVVYIEVEARPAVSPGLPPFLRGAPAEPQLGAGSGFIFSEDGYILTNDHVVQQADRVSVTLADRRRLEARVVARDPSTDVAVIKVEAEGLPVAELGSSAGVEVGEWVLALGSPLGLMFTTTAGIISAKGRAIGILGREGGGGETAPPLENFLQTDAVVNPGNSGGPLVNLAGQVIGINTAIFDPSGRGQFAGYSFAVPIDLARRVAQDLIRYGHVRRPYLGVSLQAVDPVDAAVYGLDELEGAEVKSVQEGGPAARAGLEVGDVIVGIGTEDVESVVDLQAELAQLEPGTRVELDVVRFGRRLELPVELGMVRSGVQPEAAPALAGEVQGGAGFAVVEDRGRLFVAEVRRYSPAARAGMLPGQEIVSVNRRAVESVRDLVAAVRAAEDGVLSLIVRDPQLGRTIINFQVR